MPEPLIPARPAMRIALPVNVSILGSPLVAALACGRVVPAGAAPAQGAPVIKVTAILPGGFPPLKPALSRAACLAALRFAFPAADPVVKRLVAARPPLPAGPAFASRWSHVPPVASP